MSGTEETIPYSPEAFNKAASEVNNLQSAPTSDELLKIYSLFKQHECSDIPDDSSRPGIFDPKGRAKYDEWKTQKGKPKEVAGQEYIDAVQKLKGKYGLKAGG